jgi:uridylate kinase
MTNIDYVYDGDPKTNPDATPQKHLTWSMYRSIIPTEWTPGLNTPFDPIASEKAEELGIEVAVINGSDLDRLDNYLSGDPFVGTRITP